MHGYQKSDIGHRLSIIPFNGLWVNEHYVNEIRQGKPLRESQDTGTRCIVIPTRTLQVTRCIYGFHEGGEGMVDYA